MGKRGLMMDYNIITALNLPIGSEFEVYNQDKSDKNTYIIKIVKSGNKDIGDKKLVWLDEDKEYNSPVEIDNYTSKIVLKLIHKEELNFFQAIELIKNGKKVTNEYILKSEYINNEYYYMDNNGNIVYSDGEFNIDEDEINGLWYEVE